MTGCKWIGGDEASNIFVIPRMRSCLAVDMKLLTFVTDHLNHGAGNFTSAVMEWQGQHPEPFQQDMLLGKDLTMIRATVQRLEDAWFVWRTVSLAGGRGQDIEWDFGEEGLENTFVRYAPLLRVAHRERVM